jgi:hypothetical protein
VPRNRVGERAHGLIDVSTRCFDQPPAACDLRQHPGAADSRRVVLPRVQQRDGVVRPVELEQGLDVVRPPPAQIRLTPLGRVGALLGCGEPFLRSSGIAAPEVDQAFDRDQPAEEGSLLGRKLTAAPRELSGALEVASMGGDQRAGEELLWDDEVVLLADSPDSFGVLGRQGPVPGPQLDGRQVPNGLGAHPLVPIPPVPVQSLEQTARTVGADGPDEDVSERQCHGQLALLVAALDCELVGTLGQLRCVHVALVEAKDREHPHRPGQKCVVAELVGQFDSGSRVPLRPRSAVSETSVPSQFPVQRHLEREVPFRLAKRLLEQRNGAVQAAEVGE